ncbi:uncharacterized protein LOC129717485 [Wyeomyia smithii]|uniref:uncharacterized protein LOC129717485 n=1 Tax=Wyeomyia smithii TaxID=174621 RepID=UPI002467D32B|nr:uncharacterized protein LOC129717485 [Wyeomyia smithii]
MNWTSETIIGTVKPAQTNTPVPSEPIGAVPIPVAATSKPLLPGTVNNSNQPGKPSGRIAGTINIAGSNHPGVSADELTKRAIEEINRDVRIGRIRSEQVGALGWRPCPLKKTNKRFLNRTVRSAVQHNKREAVRHFHSSTRKLIELDQPEGDTRYRQRKRSVSGSSAKVVVLDDLEDGEVRDD